MGSTIVWTWGGVAAVALAACGGSVTVEPDGSGGSGGAGTGNAGNVGNVGNGSSSGGSGNIGNAGTGGFPSSSSGVGNAGPTTTGSGGASSIDCFGACDILWSCGAADNFALCPGFASIGEANFIDGCIPGCEANPAILAIVDEDDCPGTIEILSSANDEFNFACDFGIPPG